jgi:Tfp pilus assembly protein PilF
LVGIRIGVLTLGLLALPSFARAGLYYSGETFADLPSQWNGFLLDQRALRSVAFPPTASTASPLRVKYQQALSRLEKAGRSLTADEQCDLGALYIRLGQNEKALQVLRTAQHEHPHHFRIAANLGTAWQLQGDLDQAATSLEQAVRLAPGRWQRGEEFHLKLVRLRQRQPRDSQELDDVFGVRYQADSSRYEPGKLAAAERKRLPPDAIAIVQQLALWLPADGRLLWQLAELANAQGDLRTSAAIFNGCVTEFNMRAATLREHRKLTREAVDDQAAGSIGSAAHNQHAGGLKARSRRPLVSKLLDRDLPPVQSTGVNLLPWAVLAETSIERPSFHPTFPKYLHELEGKQVALAGFVQPLRADANLSSFLLIENPVGCWYCEMPDITGIVLVQLPPEKTVTYTRTLIKVVGTLKLNTSDPENFLYTLDAAKVTEAD